MIYLIRSAAITDRDNPESEGLEFIYKIGYCDDNNEKGRRLTYLTENPTRQVLFTIPGGTEQDEKSLHHHFRKYLKYGNEWFSYNPEILEFFKTHTTKESLLELEEHLSQREQLKRQREKQSNFLKNKQKYINPILHSLGDIEIIDYIDKQEELVNIMNSLPEEKVDSYFKSNYSSINFDLTEEISISVQQILETFNSLKGFTRKMKYLYSLNMTTEIAKQVLNNIYDTSFAKYYWTISASRAGTLNYLQKNLEIEYISINNEKSENTIDKVKDKILQTFILGNKYLKSDIKEILRSIYESLNYNKTPKASDLEQYFELRACQVKNKETGKKDHGFEIIKVKE
jgi:hypothetical protein